MMNTFVRVVEAGSLSAAAKQLRISTAAASRHLAALERELGAPLLARTTRRMTITAAGQTYYQRCLAVLRDVREAREAVARSATSGTLRVSVPVTVGVMGGTALVAPLAARHPGLRFDLRLDDRLIDLALEDVDVAIRVASAPPLSTELVARVLSRWSRVVVASPAYLRKHGEPRTPAALAAHPALSSSRDVETWTMVEGTRTERVRMTVRCTTNSGHLLRDLALEGLGVTLLPSWFVAADIAGRRLRRVLPPWTSEPVVVHALYRASLRDDARVRLFLDHLRTAYAASERGPAD